MVASGGHTPPVLLRGGGEAEVVPCRARPRCWALKHDARSFDQEIELAPDDTLVLYTDGVTEARRDRPLAPEDLGAAGALRDDLAVLVVALEPTPGR